MPNFRKILENSLVADVEHYESISSTNDRALAAAADPNVRLPLLVVADTQTAGRGRGSNRWWTGPGSLAFSLLTRDVGWDKRAGTVAQRWSPSAGPPIASPAVDSGGPSLASSLVPPYDISRQAPLRPSALVALAAGVALVEAIKPLVPGHQLGIHWPNDVMLDGRKLAGILIEVLPNGKQVIGIGINTNNTAADAPADVRPRVVTLRDATGGTHDPVELLTVILNRLEEQLAELARDPRRVTERTNEVCLQRGTLVQVRQGEALIVGTCQEIASDGALVLQTADGAHNVYSGTIREMN